VREFGLTDISTISEAVIIKTMKYFYARKIEPFTSGALTHTDAALQLSGGKWNIPQVVVEGLIIHKKTNKTGSFFITCILLNSRKIKYLYLKS
jgi:hypothetical protein